MYETKCIQKQEVIETFAEQEAGRMIMQYGVVIWPNVCM